MVAVAKLKSMAASERRIIAEIEVLG